MKKLKLIKVIMLLFAFLTITVACVHDDDYATPPLVCTDATPNASLADLKALYTGTTVQITSDMIIPAYVSSSDETGNIYKTIYVQDQLSNPTQGLTISVDAYSTYAKFPVGSKVFLKVKGLYLGEYGGVIQLGDMAPDATTGAPAFGRITSAKMESVILYSCTQPTEKITPLEVSLDNLNPNLIGALVKIKKAQFAAASIGDFSNPNTYAIATPPTTVNRLVEAINPSGSIGTILLRNSGYATFVNTKLPTGNGTLTGILSKYNTDWQFYIRDTSDVDFTGARFFSEDFSGSLTTNWVAYNAVGTEVWNIQQFGNPKPCAVMNGFTGGNHNNEDWLISKPIDLSGSTNYYLSFDTDVRYAGSPLQVFIIEDANFISATPNTSPWIALSGYTLDTNSNAFGPWVNSGNVNLNAYSGKKVRIAFKYTSTTSAANTWELDNVKVIGL